MATSGQKAMWFLHELAKPEPRYNRSRHFRLSGQVDRDALERAVGALVSRHDVLRTSFFLDHGRVTAVVHPTGMDCWEFEVVDSEIGGRALSVTLAAQRTRPFDLATPQALRVTLQQITPDDHLLHVVYHQIAADERSVEVLLNELGEIYRAHSAHGAMELEHVSATAEMAERPPIDAAARRFWVDELADAPPRADLPAHLPPSEHQHQGGVWRLELAPVLTASIRRLANEANTTQSNVLFAALALMLARWGSSNDIVLGTPFAMRDESTQQVVGPLENPLPVRVQLASQQSFREVLVDLADTFARVEQECTLPFADLVRQLDRSGSADGNPLFGVHVQSRNAEGQCLDLGDLTAEPLEPTSLFARYDLDLLVTHHDNTISCSFTFSKDRFDDATMAQFVSQYEHLVNAATEAPDAEALLLPLESHSIAVARVQKVNDTQVAYPRDKTLGELFLNAVNAHADRMAIVDGNQSFTYLELGGLVDRAAQELALHGVGSGDFVEILVRPDVDTVVAMVATVLVGAAYVPLDPDLPAARLQEIRSDATAKVMVGDHQLAATLDIGPCTVIDLARIDLTCTDERAGYELPDNKITADQPAYMIYTSGSTGRPKGVLVPHRSAVRQLVNSNFLPLSPDDAVAQVSNLAFDVSVIEVWGPLLNGARIEIVPQDRRLDPRQLVDFIRDRGVTTLFLSSLHFSAVIRDVPDALKTLNTFMVGADVVQPASVRRAMVHGAPKRFLNAYGPTEASVWCCFAEISDAPSHRMDLPIGRPASNNALYVLNTAGGLAAPWEPGELHVGGDGVALGYWRQEKLTEESFIPDPWSDRAAARMYRTGDRVVQTPAGDLHFLGRVDRQVKIRGNRVELGEIEAKIAGLSGADAARVVLIGEGANQQLVGYVATTADSLLTPELVIDELKTLLPAYMVPQTMMVVDELPTNRRGKIDLDQLPTPVASAHEESTEVRGRVEHAIAQCFADVLGVHDVRTDHDFFDLGGHSLIALELLTLVEERLGIRISLVSFMRNSSVQGLLDHVDSIRAREDLALWNDHEAGAIEHGNIGAGDIDRGRARTFRGVTDPDYVSTEAHHDELERVRRIHATEIQAVKTSFKYRLGDALTSAFTNRSGARNAPTALAALAREAWSWKRNSTIEPTPQVAPTWNGQLEPIERIMSAWDGVRAHESSLLVQRNSTGRGRPLYWCCNGERGLDAIALHLGPAQPVVGMRSALGVCEPMWDMIPAMASRYANEIVELDPTGPYIIGGNCAGAEVAYAMASELERLGKQVELLIVMERVIDAPYSGDVLLLFGDVSQNINPYLSGAPSDELFDRNYGSYRVDTVRGRHGSFFRSPNIEVLAATLQRYIKDPGAQPLAPPVASTPEVEPVVAYRPQESVLSETGRTENELPPGDLARIDHGEHKHRRFLLDRSHALGPIFKATTSGDRLVVCVVGFENCKRLLRDHGDQLGPDSMALGAIIPKGIIREMHGADHDAYRGTLIRALAGATASSIDAIAADAANHVLRHLAELNTPADPQELLDALNTIATSTLVEIFFGVHASTADHRALVAGFERLGPDGLVWVPGSPQIAAFAELRKLLLDVAERPGTGAIPGVLHRLASNGDLDETSLGNLIYMVEIGRFDMASLMRWLVKLAAENPSILEEMRSSPDSEDHTSSCSEAFVLETLRLHQSERLMRVALDDLSFDGYHIPKNTIVRLCLWESHKDSNTFQDPFRFDPRRFTHGSYTADQYAPFGLGRRRCPASDIAIRMAAALVSTMATQVNPTIVEDGPPIHGAWHWEPNPSMRVRWQRVELTQANLGHSDQAASPQADT